MSMYNVGRLVAKRQAAMVGRRRRAFREQGTVRGSDTAPGYCT